MYVYVCAGVTLEPDNVCINAHEHTRTRKHTHKLHLSRDARVFGHEPIKNAAEYVDPFLVRQATNEGNDGDVLVLLQPHGRLQVELAPYFTARVIDGVEVVVPECACV